MKIGIHVISESTVGSVKSATKNSLQKIIENEDIIENIERSITQIGRRPNIR